MTLSGSFMFLFTTTKNPCQSALSVVSKKVDFVLDVLSVLFFLTKQYLLKTTWTTWDNSFHVNYTVFIVLIYEQFMDIHVKS